MEKITAKEKWGYGMGEGANCILFGLVQSILQKYYTDILGIGVLNIMLLFILARFWDAVNDPLWGHIVARVKPDATGRYRRWVKYFAVPLCLISVLMFVKIPGLGQTGNFVWACVTYVLFGMAYTVINIPYGSMLQVMTPDSGERASLSVARSLGGVFGAIPALILISFCYDKLPGGAKQMSHSKILAGAALIALLALACYWAFYRFTRERVAAAQAKTAEKGVFGRSLRALCKNRAFVAACLVAMLFVASQQFSVSYSTYLFQYYFNAPELTMLPSIFAYLPVAVMMFFATKLGNRFGRKELSAYGLLFAGVGNLILYFLHTADPWVYMMVLLISGVGTTFIYLLLWAIASDAIDHVALTLGVEDAYGYSFFSFVRKLGHCVAAVCVNLALWKIGYEGNVLNAANITGGTLSEMYMYSVLVPALLYLASFVILRFVYPLGKRQIQSQQAQRVSAQA